MRLDGKVSIITGGGSGMGRVAAELFAREGARVVVAEFDEAAGEATVAAVTAAGGEATLRAGRRLERGGRERDGQARRRHLWPGRLAVQQCRHHARGRPLGRRHRCRRPGTASWRSTSAACSSAASTRSRDARRRARGRSSTSRASSRSSAARCPQDAYTASKGAVLALTRSLAVQFAAAGVRTNAISPGPIETPLLMDWLLKDEAAKQLRLARNPTGRFGKPEEIVNVGIYLASDESRWTNGANFVDRRRDHGQLLLRSARPPRRPRTRRGSGTGAPDRETAPTDVSCASASRVGARRPTTQGRRRRRRPGSPRRPRPAESCRRRPGQGRRTRRRQSTRAAPRRHRRGRRRQRHQGGRRRPRHRRARSRPATACRRRSRPRRPP